MENHIYYIVTFATGKIYYQILAGLMVEYRVGVIKSAGEWGLQQTE